MLIKKYNEFISEEIINMPSWPSLNNSDKNGYVLPMLLWVSDVFEDSFKDGDYDSEVLVTGVKLVKKWNLDGVLSGSYFKFEKNGIIFIHLNDKNLEYCDSKPSGYQLPKDIESRVNILFDKYHLGSPIFSIVVKDFEDGVKVVTTGSNWHLIKKLGIKRLGIKTYKSFVKELNIPLYSDDTQTPESKEAIWKKLLQDKSCEIVGWSQNQKVELPIEMIEGNPYYRGGIPIYFGDKEINRQTLDLASENEIKYLKMKSMTKNLKLKSVK